MGGVQTQQLVQPLLGRVVIAIATLQIEQQQTLVEGAWTSV